ncbi:uncharacterized protein [Lepidochelys kempii]|uniref:uncharacterized protein isoform X2 n=1 Tax=Lepidochelys kempii TaxID=8472 RepID=UPI003C6EE1BA
MGRKGPSASLASWGCSPRRSSSFRSHSGLRLSGAQLRGVGGSAEGPHCPVMASALTVLFFGCWLTGHSGAWGEPSYPKPSISLSPSEGVSLGGAVSVWCWGQHQGVRFVLNKEGRHFPAVDSSGSGAVFFISNVSREHGGRYSCSYHSRSGSAAASSPSDPVELAVRGGINLTLPGAAPAPTQPGSVGPAAPGLTTLIIAGASAAAAGLLLLLLLVAFVCLRKTRARKEATPRPSSTIPLGKLEALAQQDPNYCFINEGKEPQTLPQEPDPGTDGLTYAELDRQALHAKPGGPPPAPEPTQPSMYAVISVSQGALQ